MKIEQDYEANRSLAYKKVEDDNLAAAERLQHKLKIKAQGIEFKTRVEFDNTVYLLISDSEDILKQRQALKDATFIPQDDMKTIKRFYSNMALGRHYYVGYSIANGFKSINYQDPETGDSSLHLAVRNGTASSRCTACRPKSAVHHKVTWRPSRSC